MEEKGLEERDMEGFLLMMEPYFDRLLLLSTSEDEEVPKNCCYAACWMTFLYSGPTGTFFRWITVEKSHFTLNRVTEAL